MATNSLSNGTNVVLAARVLCNIQMTSTRTAGSFSAHELRHLAALSETYCSAVASYLEEIGATPLCSDVTVEKVTLSKALDLVNDLWDALFPG